MKSIIRYFVAPLVLSANVSIDPATLHNVFGFPYSNSVAPNTAAASPAYPGQVYPAQRYPSQAYGVQPLPKGQVAQVAAITPANGTLVDLDYWDSMDDYTPSATDYDKFDWTLTKVSWLFIRHNSKYRFIIVCHTVKMRMYLSKEETIA